MQRKVLELETKITNHPAFGTDYKWSPKDFELGSDLGKGAFGQVNVAREKRTGYLVAIKTMFKSQITKYKFEEQVTREIEIQSHLQHPNILRLLTWFHDERRIYLVMEYASGGALNKLLKKSPNGRFSRPRAAKYIYQVADAVEYCHKLHVIHRDIKPDNILISYHGNIKLADFGLSVHSSSNRRETICGSLNYMPPEMIMQEVHDAFVDHWAIGVLLYEFLVGKPPFDSEEQVVEETQQKILSLDIVYPSWVQEDAKDLISKLLQFSSKNRLSLDGVKKHVWVQLYYTPV